MKQGATEDSLRTACICLGKCIWVRGWEGTEGSDTTHRQREGVRLRLRPRMMPANSIRASAASTNGTDADDVVGASDEHPRPCPCPCSQRSHHQSRVGKGPRHGQSRFSHQLMMHRALDHMPHGLVSRSLASPSSVLAQMAAASSRHVPLPCRRRPLALSERGQPLRPSLASMRLPTDSRQDTFFYKPSLAG